MEKKSFLLLLAFLVGGSTLMAQPTFLTTQWTNQSGTGGTKDYSGGLNFEAAAQSNHRIIVTPDGTGDNFFRFKTSTGTQRRPSVDGTVLPTNTATPTIGLLDGSFNAFKINAPNTTDNYVFRLDAGVTRVAAFRIQGSIQSITTHTAPTGIIGTNQSVVISANLSGAFATGQAAYLRYTTNAFATSTVVKMTRSGTTVTATIPAQAAGANVVYYLFTSGDFDGSDGSTGSTAMAAADADLYTINILNNGGLNYSYTVASGAVYTWNATTGSASWVDPASWTPARTSPVATDLLFFSNGGSSTATAVPTQTIGALQISNNTSIALQASSASTITINNGLTGADLSVPAGTALLSNGTSALTITHGTNASASISGTVTFQNADHRLNATTAGSITFNSGGKLNQFAGCNGNIFTSAGTANVVTFANGSEFIQQAGANPFGLSQPSSKVVFQAGSWFRFQFSSTPSFSGRTYANFEFNPGTGTQSPTGATAVIIDSLKITSGTFNIGMTVASSIRGNIDVATGATLNINGSGGINLNGGGTQTIYGGGTLTVASGQSLNIASGTTVNLQRGINTSGTVAVSGTLNLGTQIISGTGSFTLNSGGTLGIGSTGGIAASGATGNIQTTTRNFNTGGNYAYNGAANQITGSGLPATISTLTINNTGGSGNNTVTLSAATSVTATTNSFRLIAGLFSMNGFSLTIPNNGTVAGTGGDFDAANGPLTFAGAGTVSGTLTLPTVVINGGVNFGTGATIRTSLQLNAGSFISTNPATYAVGSFLIYNTGGTYGRNLEWSSTSGAGYPHHVIIQNGTTLDLSANGDANRATAGNLILGSGTTAGSLSMGAMASRLTVNGALLIGENISGGTSTLTLSTNVSSPALDIGGSYNRGANGSLVTNGRGVFFIGSSAATLNSTSTENFAFLFINKTDAGVLSLINNIQVNNNLTLNDTLVTGINKVIIPASSGVTANSTNYIQGNLERGVPTGASVVRDFVVGTAEGKASVSVTFTNVSTAGNLLVSPSFNDHPDVANSGIRADKTVNRHWSITNSGIVFNTSGNSANVVFNWNTSDVDAGADFNDFIVANLDGSVWTLPTVSSKTATSISATSLTSFSDFQVGETCGPPTVSLVGNNGPICAGDTAVFTVNGTSGAILTYTITGLVGNQTLTLTGANQTITLPNASSNIQLSFVSASLSSCTITYTGVNSTVVVNQPSSTTENISICPQAIPYEWNGFLYTVSGTYTYTTTNAVGCDSVVTLNLNILNPYIPPLGIIGPVDVCGAVGLDSTITYTIQESRNIDSLVWTVPAGVNIVGGGAVTDTFIQVRYTTSFNTGRINVVGYNTSCGFSISRSTRWITRYPAPRPARIFGITDACPFIEGDSAIFYVNDVIGAASYEWTVGPGMEIVSGQGDTLVAIRFLSNFTGANVAVRSISQCGNSSLTQLTVKRIIPKNPGSITGLTNVCSIVGTGIDTVYTINKVLHADAYEWLVPAGATITDHPNGPGENDTIVRIRFEAGYTQGNLAVRASNECFTTNPSRPLFIRRLIPATPGTITGPVDACPLMGTGTDVTYSIRKVLYANAYNWVVPAGVTVVDHPSGPGENDTVIIVRFENSYLSGNIRVQALNDCHTTSFRSIALKRNLPRTPGTISGPTETCPLIDEPTEATYSINKVLHATSYLWAVPVGATITGHPAGLGENDTVITVSFSGSFVPGNLTVRAVNNCFTSGIKTLSLKRSAAATPGIISSNLLSGCPGRTYAFSIPSMPANATSLVWTVPTGATILSGQGTTYMTASIPAGGTLGVVSVQAFNNCSSSGVRAINANYAACTGPVAPPPTITSASASLPESDNIVSVKGLSAKAYPNPSTNRFVIRLNTPNPTELLSVRVTDLLGRVVESRSGIMPAQWMELGANYQPGIYMVQIAQGKLNTSLKLVKK